MKQTSHICVLTILLPAVMACRGSFKAEGERSTRSDQIPITTDRHKADSSEIFSNQGGDVEVTIDAETFAQDVVIEFEKIATDRIVDEDNKIVLSSIEISTTAVDGQQISKDQVHQPFLVSLQVSGPLNPTQLEILVIENAGMDSESRSVIPTNKLTLKELPSGQYEVMFYTDIANGIFVLTETPPLESTPTPTQTPIPTQSPTNQPPQWPNTSLSIDISTDVAFSETYVADDEDSGDVLTYSLVDSPSDCRLGSWSPALQVDTQSGQVVGTPSVGDVGTCTLTVEVSDGSADATLSIEINIHPLQNICDLGTLNTECRVTSAGNPHLLPDSAIVAGTGDIIVENGATLTSARLEKASIKIGGDLTIENGGLIAANLTDLSAENLTIQSTGSINVSDLGDLGGDAGDGDGPGGGGGVSPSDGNGCSGAGHGGYGSDGSGTVTTGGIPHGSASSPVAFGSGGGGCQDGYAAGGNGGGVVRISIRETLTLEGSIVANGTAGEGVSTRAAGGGSGGSIWIDAKSLAGSNAGATLAANGGDGGYSAPDSGGGGSGGRIALYFETDSYAGTMTAFGGAGGGGAALAGAAGTIYLRNNTDETVAMRFIGQHSGTSKTLFDPEVISTNDITIGGEADVFLTNGTTLTIANDFTLCTNCSLGVYDVSDVLTIDITGNLILSSGAQVIAENINASGEVAINSGASVQGHTIDITATNLTIASGGEISADGMGYAGVEGNDGLGPAGGVGVSSGGCGGGGYGGVGGDGSDTAGGSPTYGSNTAPDDFGSAGGGCQVGYTTGGNGGGKIKLTLTDTLVVDGTISANGTDGESVSGRQSGGGAGGSIWIQTEILNGSDGAATIRADGGDGGVEPTWPGGGGGGGRIAIYRTTDAGYSGSVTVNGGLKGGAAAADGAAGTTYIP